MRRERSGTGITARTLHVPDTQAEQANALAQAKEYFTAMATGYSGDFERTSRLARAVVEAISAEGKPLVADSPAAFAASILTALTIAQEAVAAGNADLAASMAFRSGAEWERARMKWKWEKAALAGKLHLDKSKEGAAKRRGDFADHTPDVLAEMTRLTVSGKSVSRAAELCAKKGIGTSTGANRKLWYDHRRKVDTNP